MEFPSSSSGICHSLWGVDSRCLHRLAVMPFTHPQKAAGSFSLSRLVSTVNSTSWVASWASSSFFSIFLQW